MLSDSISVQIIMQNFLSQLQNSALTTVMMNDLFLLFHSRWAEELIIIDFLVDTPYIPDSPPK